MEGRAYRPGVVRVGDLLVAERASCETERSRGALSYGPRTGRGAVEAFPSGVPRTSRSWSAVEAPRRAGLVRDGPCMRSRRAAFCCGLIVSFFFTIGCGYPYTAGTDNIGGCLLHCSSMKNG
jgi:hypothetical protein